MLNHHSINNEPLNFAQSLIKSENFRYVLFSQKFEFFKDFKIRNVYNLTTTNPQMLY